MSKLHILFIASWYPGPDNPTHGIFNRLFVSAAALRATVSVLYVSPGKGDESGFSIASEEEDSVFTVRVSYPGSAHRRSLLNKAQQFVRRIRATEKGFEVIRQKIGIPDLVQLNVVLPAGPAALHICRKFSLPLVVNEGWTGYDFEDGRYRGFVTKYLTRKVVAAAKRILPVTGYLSELMQKHGLAGNYTVVPNIVDTSVFKLSALQVGSASFRFIHVSALDDDQKNVSGILRAFANALKQVHQAELVIAGHGPDAQKLKLLAVSLGLENHVRFVGSKDPSELSALFQQSGALVMFSNYETFCVVVPEALACGIPVITSDAGGIMSYFDKAMGVVVPRRDEQALSDAMVSVASKEMKFEPARLRAFVVSNFSKEVVSEKLIAVYQSILKR